MTSSQLQNQLENEIPITKTLGFKINSLSLQEAKCLLPLQPNINHKQTLFGGSQYSGCALACYSLFLFNVRGLKETTNNIVVSKAEISYKKPVTEDAQIVATWLSDEERVHFLESLQRKGKARVRLLARVIGADDLLLSEFQGHFVVILK